MKGVPATPSFGILGKLLHQKFQIIGIERQIRVQISDHFKPERLDPRQARIKCVDFSGKTAFQMFRAADQFNPRVAFA